MEFAQVEGTSDAGGARPGGATADENRADFVHGRRWRRLRCRFPVEASALQFASSGSGCFGENPRSGSPGSDDDGAFGVVFPPGGIVFEQVLDGEDYRRSGIPSTARLTADPGGMALRRFGDGRRQMDTCRMVALSGTVVALTAGLARSVRR